MREKLQLFFKSKRLDQAGYITSLISFYVLRSIFTPESLPPIKDVFDFNTLSQIAFLGTCILLILYIIGLFFGARHRARLILLSLYLVLVLLLAYLAFITLLMSAAAYS